jgi:large subunit ribosomal protein L10
MARPEKEQVVAEFTEYLDRAQSVYVADYQGLNVELISELRAAMRAEGVKMRVAKNTLVKRAMDQVGQKDLAGTLTGPNAFVFGFDDPVVPARIIREFQKNARVDKPAVRGFVLDGEYMPGERFDEIASLPGKAELVAKVVGSVQAPLANLVFTLQAILRELVGTLQALADKREGEK